MSFHASSRAEAAAEHLQRKWSSSLTITLALSVESNATPAWAVNPARQFAADELPLDEELPVEVGKRRNVEVFEFELAFTLPMASLPRETTSALCEAVAHAWRTATSARFRARRMRVDTTTSDSGPVPRSHSAQIRQ